MAILLIVHLTRHSSTASEQLSCISPVPAPAAPSTMHACDELNLAIWQDDPIALKLPLRTRSDGGQRSSRALMKTDAPAGLPTTPVTINL
jgi:hypothetical protein